VLYTADNCEGVLGAEASEQLIEDELIRADLMMPQTTNTPHAQSDLAFLAVWV
jgi:hypothetical protein